MGRLLREWNGWRDPTESGANEEACRHPRGKQAISRPPFLVLENGNNLTKVNSHLETEFSVTGGLYGI
ncbi:hypothetical protein HM131_03885 [Halobacillus mangrovi]|uniref:Uncharacterized protein n=1 Tax=Halobacillus mangrovi TaxID=402384 RepID=A0A1W5ZRV3_9BACI|nr:hypothetical protein HM131_03885 [Halobacillus mangrovi]